VLSVALIGVDSNWNSTSQAFSKFSSIPIGSIIHLYRRKIKLQRVKCQTLNIGYYGFALCGSSQVHPSQHTAAFGRSFITSSSSDIKLL
jgi:hypothetical protein